MTINNRAERIGIQKGPDKPGSDLTDPSLQAKITFMEQHYRLGQMPRVPEAEYLDALLKQQAQRQNR